MAEPRPAALPPAERTIGQLVAESIRFYGEHFWGCLSLGLAPAALAAIGANVSRSVALVLSPTLFGALLSATFVGASVLVLEQRPASCIFTLHWPPALLGVALLLVLSSRIVFVKWPINQPASTRCNLRCLRLRSLRPDT